MYASPGALLRKYGLHAKKSWGQNFLVDERTLAAIVAATAPGEGDVVVEIGAGLGSLTARLAAAAGSVLAIERDRDLVAVLRRELGDAPGVTIVEANALTFDYPAAAAAAGRPLLVVGNLPYQIASPLLFRLLDARAHVARIVIMLQREMAERIVARPATSAYGALSVMVQLHGQPRTVCKVARGAFLPAPNVDSSVLCIEPFAAAAGSAHPAGLRVALDDEAGFSRVVHAAFGQRRKMLRNALAALAGDDAIRGALAAAEIDGQRRGETLSVEEFARLANAVAAAAAR